MGHKGPDGSDVEDLWKTGSFRKFYSCLPGERKKQYQIVVQSSRRICRFLLKKVRQRVVCEWQLKPTGIKLNPRNRQHRCKWFIIMQGSSVLYGQNCWLKLGTSRDSDCSQLEHRPVILSNEMVQCTVMLYKCSNEMFLLQQEKSCFFNTDWRLANESNSWQDPWVPRL